MKTKRPKMTFRDGQGMYDFLAEKGIDPPMEIGELYDSAIAHGYNEPLFGENKEYQKRLQRIKNENIKTAVRVEVSNNKIFWTIMVILLLWLFFLIC